MIWSASVLFLCEKKITPEQQEEFQKLSHLEKKAQVHTMNELSREDFEKRSSEILRGSVADVLSDRLSSFSSLDLW